jgi:hypothetical protein
MWPPGAAQLLGFLKVDPADKTALLAFLRTL